MKREVRLQLVLVDWIDAAGVAAHWAPLEDVKSYPQRCQSVGWLLEDEPDFIVVAPHVGLDENGWPEQVVGDMCIPRSAIKRIAALPEPTHAKRQKASRK
jgi:hypothetical protein